MDATHSTTVYDFLLISIMIVDEYYEGIPVGFCIANREDCTVLKIFKHCQDDSWFAAPNCVIVSGCIKGAARATNVMYPCGFICNPVVLTLHS